MCHKKFILLISVFCSILKCYSIVRVRAVDWGWGQYAGGAYGSYGGFGGYDWASYPMRHGLWLGSYGYLDGDMNPNIAVSGCECDLYSYPSNVYPCC